MLGAAGMACAVGQLNTWYLRPNADVTANWSTFGSGTGLWGRIDEETADDDTTYIYVDIDDNSIWSAECEFHLGDVVSAIDIDELVRISIRLKKKDYIGSIDQVEFAFQLMEGSTQRDAWTELVEFDDAYLTRTRNLSAGVKAAISNWDDLRIRAKARAIGEPPATKSTYARITQVWMRHRG